MTINFVFISQVKSRFSRNYSRVLLSIPEDHEFGVEKELLTISEDEEDSDNTFPKV